MDRQFVNIISDGKIVLLVMAHQSANMAALEAHANLAMAVRFANIIVKKLIVLIVAEQMYVFMVVEGGLARIV